MHDHAVRPGPLRLAQRHVCIGEQTRGILPTKGRATDMGNVRGGQLQVPVERCDVGVDLLAEPVALGEQLLELVSRTINDLYFRLSVTNVSVDPASIIKGFAAGVGAALLAAAVPALWQERFLSST